MFHLFISNVKSTVLSFMNMKAHRKINSQFIPSELFFLSITDVILFAK